MTASTVKEESESINILVTGKTGVGKSSITNAIIGEIVAEEGKSLGGVTRDISCHERTVNHIKFKVWKSSGLQDITDEDGEITKRIMQTLKQHCSHLHLLLYCIRMDRDRIEISEFEAIKQLSQLFSPKIWESAIFALTFANRVIPPPDMATDEEEAQWFKERIKMFQAAIVRTLVEVGVPEDKAKQVPVIPTGYHKPTKHMPNPWKLFDRPNWFNPFSHSCAKQMEEHTIMTLLASQKHRVQKLTEAQTTSIESHAWKTEVSDSSSWAALFEKTNNNSPDELKEEVKPMQKRNVSGNQKEIEKYKKLLRHLYDKNFDAKGVAFVIGISGPEGVEIDVENMTSTFKELHLAVSSHNDLTSSELISLLHVACTSVYPPGYKFIVFYYAGHGGVDPGNGEGYVLPLQLQEAGDPEKVYIEDDIVSRFSTEISPLLEYRYRILLFDCCLSTQSTRNDPEDLSTKPQKFDLKAHGGCLVAYATSRSYKSEGDNCRGGLWTYHLHQNLKLPMPISVVLDRTHDAVRKESRAYGRIQEPNYHSCIGEVYLKDTDSVPNLISTSTSSVQKNPKGQTVTNTSILKKSPEKIDVFNLLKKKSAHWDDFARELNIDDNSRQELAIEGNTTTSRSKLEKVLVKWINGETSEVTWKYIIDVLEGLEFIELARNVKDFLRKQDVVKKYSEKRDFEDIPVSLEAVIEALKEGSGHMNLALILMHGAPSVGKSSVNRLLQGLPPLPKSQQHSTALFENAVRLINTGQLALTPDNVLDCVDEKKLMIMFANYISQRMEESTIEASVTQVTQTLSHKTPQSLLQSTSHVISSSSDIPTMDTNQVKISDAVTEINNPTKYSSDLFDSVPTIHTDEFEISDVMKDIVTNLNRGTRFPSHLFNDKWFHIVDSGGQPQFGDVLPLMFPKVSLHMVVIRLDEKLDDKPKIRYLVAGEDNYDLPENLSLSYLQMIERTCELAQAAATKNQEGHSPRVVIVATRLDCVCPEESLRQKNRRLEEVFERYKHIIVRKSSSEIIFAMNAMIPEGEVRKEYTCVLQNVLLNAPPVHTSDVEVPVRWMLLYLELSRLSEEGLLEMSTCEAVADRLEMRNDLSNALDYFTKVALHMRFADKLPKLVFTQVAPIVSRLSTVIAASFTQPEFDPIQQERENLKRKGIVTKAFVHKLFKDKFKQNPFSVDDFFSLLEHLLIAVNIDDSEYFIPCVLPLDDPNPEDFPTKSASLPVLLTWNKEVLPQGFFPALIVKLLQRKTPPIFTHCAGEKQLRRAVYLNSEYGALRLVDQTSWFELYFAGKMQYSPIVLEAVEDSSRALVDVLKIHGFGELKRAFHCTGVCGSKDPVHPALLTVTNEGQCTKREACRFPLSSQHMCWINATEETNSTDTRPAPKSSNVLRSNHADLCRLLNGSEPTLLSLTAELYAKGIIDTNIKIDVLNKGGFSGADILLTHVQMKIEQSPEHLDIVQKAMENEQFLHEIVKKMKKETTKEHI